MGKGYWDEIWDYIEPTRSFPFEEEALKIEQDKESSIKSAEGDRGKEKEAVRDAGEKLLALFGKGREEIECRMKEIQDKHFDASGKGDRSLMKELEKEFSEAKAKYEYVVNQEEATKDELLKLNELSVAEEKLKSVGTEEELIVFDLLSPEKVDTWSEKGIFSIEIAYGNDDYDNYELGKIFVKKDGVIENGINEVVDGKTKKTIEIGDNESKKNSVQNDNEMEIKEKIDGFVNEKIKKIIKTVGRTHFAHKDFVKDTSGKLKLFLKLFMSKRFMNDLFDGKFLETFYQNACVATSSIKIRIFPYTGFSVHDPYSPDGLCIKVECAQCVPWCNETGSERGWVLDKESGKAMERIFYMAFEFEYRPDNWEKSRFNHIRLHVNGGSNFFCDRDSDGEYGVYTDH